MEAVAGCHVMSRPPPSPAALDRFLAAQNAIFTTALAELQAGRKRSHWMWFVFPQIAGLGHSATARHYAVADRAEARAYLAHSVLAARLQQVVAAAIAAPGSAEQIFGSIDAMKLRSCLTLFAAAADDPAPFVAGLDRFFGGARDPATLAILDRGT